MVDCDQLTEHAKLQGVELYDIAACEIPGKGLGIKATKAVKSGSCLLVAPVSTLKTVLTLPEHIKLIKDCSVNGALAAELATSTLTEDSPWVATLPTLNDLKNSMPIYWPESLQQVLPFGSLDLLKEQQRKVQRDWKAVSAALEDISYDIYLFAWLVVSTRTFFYSCDEIDEIYGPLESDDCLALVPYADYFNHAATGCSVKYSETGYEIFADKDIAKGEEIVFSYGNHNNDFLLIEYGFVLEENQWDEIRLDGMILPLLSTKQQKYLQEVDFLGRYVLSDEVCYRTQAALRLLIMPIKEWQTTLQEGFNDGDKYQEAVDKRLLAILLDFQAATGKTISQIPAPKSGYASQCDLLQRRWQQVQKMIVVAISKITST